jgi:hypothetical protein
MPKILDLAGSWKMSDEEAEEFKVLIDRASEKRKIAYFNDSIMIISEIMEKFYIKSRLLPKYGAQKKPQGN